MNSTFILLGSNLGQREAILDNAISQLSAYCGTIQEKSSVYESKAWGFEAEEKFLNQVIILRTKLGPYALLARLQEIEKRMGRVRTKPGYESRIIDLDILYFNDQIIKSETLTIPHPGMHLRAFTMAPLAEIAPKTLHPILQLSHTELLTILPDKNEVKRLF